MKRSQLLRQAPGYGSAWILVLCVACASEDPDDANSGPPGGSAGAPAVSPSVPNATPSTSPTAQPAPTDTSTGPGTVSPTPTVAPTIGEPNPTVAPEPDPLPTAAGGASNPTPTGTGGAPNMGGTPNAGGTPGAGGETPSGGTPGTGGEEPGPAAPEPIVPTVSGTTYSLQVGDLTFSADGPSGRVTTLSRSGTNLLTGPNLNATNYGSSFWPAPQTWEWPPAIDAVAYTHSLDAASNSIVFTSGQVNMVGTIAVTKRFSADPVRQSLVLEYTMNNAGSSAVQLAPWEITRVRSNGLTFYPQGANAPRAQTGEYSPPAITTVTVTDGIVWFDFTGPDTESKSVSDGAEGWLAHVDAGVLFLKTFDDVPATAQAPGEAEIEIYCAGGDTYIELEQQGPYASIAAGASSTPWRVNWRVRPVPAEVQVGVGSASLVEWVRSVAAE